jgi:hypothetical protein
VSPCQWFSLSYAKRLFAKESAVLGFHFQEPTISHFLSRQKKEPPEKAVLKLWGRHPACPSSVRRQERPRYRILVTFVNNVASFNLLDDFCVVIVQRASAFVSFFNSSVKTSLFDVPSSDFQMLINVHGILLVSVS